MTTAKSVANIILDEGGSNELTIYTQDVEKIYAKKLVSITPPQSTANFAAGPKDTLIVDLLRIEVRFNVRGSIASADETKLQNIFNAGGVFNMKFKGTTFTICADKLTIRNIQGSENDETSIMFTAIVGVNI